MLAATLVLAFAPLVALLPVLKVVLPIVLPPVLAWATYRLDRYVAGKTKNEKLARVIGEFTKAVTDAVLAVQQTYVDDLVAASADGTLTESEKRQALTKAAALAVSMLPKEVESLLLAYYGTRFSGVLEGMIEAEVSRTKTGRGALALKFPKKSAPAEADSAKKK